VAEALWARCPGALRGPPAAPRRRTRAARGSDGRTAGSRSPRAHSPRCRPSPCHARSFGSCPGTPGAAPWAPTWPGLGSAGGARAGMPRPRARLTPGCSLPTPPSGGLAVYQGLLPPPCQRRCWGWPRGLQGLPSRAQAVCPLHLLAPTPGPLAHLPVSLRCTSGLLTSMTSDRALVLPSLRSPAVHSSSPRPSPSPDDPPSSVLQLHAALPAPGAAPAPQPPAHRAGATGAASPGPVPAAASCGIDGRVRVREEAVDDAGERTGSGPRGCHRAHSQEGRLQAGEPRGGEGLR